METDCLGGLSVEERIILKLVLKEIDFKGVKSTELPQNIVQ